MTERLEQMVEAVLVKHAVPVYLSPTIDRGDLASALACLIREMVEAAMPTLDPLTAERGRVAR